MHTTLAIARRELASFFRLPVGWVAMALFAAAAGVVFCVSVLREGAPASLRPLYALSGWLLLPVAPAISMRLFSDELRAGTIEPLMTSPARDGSIVAGKFLGAAGFLFLTLSPLAVLAGVLAWAASPAPDAGAMLAGALALGLSGLLFLSIGAFCSSLTGNQTLAFLAGFFAILALLLLPALPMGALPEWARGALVRLAPTPRLGDFARGVIDTRHAAYFLSGALVMLVLTTLSLQSRRWR